MAQRADDIRHDIENTRAAMTRSLPYWKSASGRPSQARKSRWRRSWRMSGIVTDVGYVKDVGGIGEG